jgi:hypothetical protein
MAGNYDAATSRSTSSSGFGTLLSKSNENKTSKRSDNNTEINFSAVSKKDLYANAPSPIENNFKSFWDDLAGGKNVYTDRRYA